MDEKYVERRDSGFYLAGSRVPLDAIVHEYWNSEVPEAIRAHYPSLSLEQVYGAITFYLGHQVEVDASIEAREGVEDAFGESHAAPAHLKAKLARGRHQSPAQSN